jgi:hypothetical protein
LDTQLRADLGRSKFKAELSSARVNVSQRHRIGRESKLGWRYGYKLHICLVRANGECRSSKDFSSLPTYIAAHTIQLVAQPDRVSEGTDCNSLPCRNIADGLDRQLGRLGGGCLEF